MAITLLAR